MIRNPSWNPLSDTTAIMVLAIVYVLAATCYHLGTILEPSARSASNVIFASVSKWNHVGTILELSLIHI